MKVNIYLKGKKISRKKAIELIGEVKLNKRIEECKKSYYEDPFEDNSYMDGMSFTFENL